MIIQMREVDFNMKSDVAKWKGYALEPDALYSCIFDWMFEDDLVAYV